MTATTLHPEQLQAMLPYRNENIISRFTDLLDVSTEEAEDIFEETKKFLYLCQLPDIFISDDLLIIDEMWHNFILFTKEYHRFCLQHFERYFHHLPASKQEKEAATQKMLQDPIASKEAFNNKMRHLMGATYDQLGEATVVKWFQVYPEQYSRSKIFALRKR